jgi:ribonuclease HII
MVVGACVLGSAEIDGLDDSKKLSAKKREKLAYEIKDKAACVATGWVTAGEIDDMGLAAALKLAARRAVAKIDVDYDEIIIDGTIKLINDARVVTLPKADGLIKSVSAASIVAKVARDMYMTKLAEKYPEYGFDKHMGYGTAKHRMALEKYGICPEHRKSFAPVAAVIASGAKQSSNNVIPGLTRNPDKSRMDSGSEAGMTAQSGKSPRNDATNGTAKDRTSTEIGNSAEDAAAEYLVGLGHEILVRNWKTKTCEIDIVSVLGDELYFTEVKYRRNHRAGGGIDAIDAKKELRMRFAAKVYLEFNELDDKTPAILSAISLTGNPPKVETYVPNIDV